MRPSIFQTGLEKSWAYTWTRNSPVWTSGPSARNESVKDSGLRVSGAKASWMGVGVVGESEHRQHCMAVLLSLARTRSSLPTYYFSMSVDVWQ
jgi:hypothetical protein